MTDSEIMELIGKLKRIQPNRWFKITGRVDADNLLQVIKLLILIHRWDNGEPEFVLHNDYGSFMLNVAVPMVTEYHTMIELPAGIKLKKTSAKRNFVWEKQDEFVYNISKDGNTIAIETS